MDLTFSRATALWTAWGTCGGPAEGAPALVLISRPCSVHSVDTTAMLFRPRLAILLPSSFGVCLAEMAVGLDVVGYPVRGTGFAAAA